MSDIWKGAITPGWVKGVVSASFDPDDADEVITEDTVGVMSVTFHNGTYEWDEVTFAEFEDFEAAGFSTSYLLEHFPINPGR